MRLVEGFFYTQKYFKERVNRVSFYQQNLSYSYIAFQDEI